MAAKRPLRDLRWALRARGVANPLLPDRVTSMLFVCLGNICRSPFAALQAEQLLEEAGRTGVRCDSAGIRASQANRSPEEACHTAARYGLSLTAHQPRQLTPESMAAYDVIVVMEASQLEHLRSVYPEHLRRILLLSLFDPLAAGSYEQLNIADPFGHPIDAYMNCYRRIDRSLRRFVALVPGSSRTQ